MHELTAQPKLSRFKLLKLWVTLFLVMATYGGWVLIPWESPRG